MPENLHVGLKSLCYCLECLTKIARNLQVGILAKCNDDTLCISCHTNVLKQAGMTSNTTF